MGNNRPRNSGQDNDVITGGAGNDAINGNLGDDRIDGGSGEDVLRGGKGDDFIVGGAGNDTIMGDLGADTLTGSAGADIFQFRGNDVALIGTDTLLGHIETVTDFTVGEDALSIGYRPTAILFGAAGSLRSALTAATDALLGHTSSAAAIAVGGDTYLFYTSSGSGVIADSVIDLQHLRPADLTVNCFI